MPRPSWVRGDGARTRRASQLPPSPPTRNVSCDCPMVRAVRAVRAGRFRLAGRYAAMAVRAVGRRINDACGLDMLRA